MWAVTSPALVSWCSSKPTPYAADSTGMLCGPTEPKLAVVRFGAWPSLNMTTALAPFCTARATFDTNVQVPRWIRAMSPGANPAAV